MSSRSNENRYKLSLLFIARLMDRWLHHRLPSTAPPGLIDTPQRGVRRVARGATPGERGRGAGFYHYHDYHDKNSLNLMPLP